MNPNYKERVIGNLKVVEIPGDPEKGVVVLLHGFGADEYDLTSLSETCYGPTWIFPQGPLTVPFSDDYVGRAWFPLNLEILAKSVRDAKNHEIAQAFPNHLKNSQQLIENFLNQLEVPRSKIILGGFSQGGVLAVETTLRSFERCAGLIVLSGTLIPEYAFHWKQLAPLHAKTPFFQSHGTHDPLLPMANAQELEKLLVDSGLKGKLHTFAGGHEIPPSILKQLSAFLHHLIK